MYKYFTSESVCSGHPDKICDQISDAIVDEAIKIYLKSRVAIETLVTKNQIVIAGEVTCPQKLNYQKIAKEVINILGYTEEIYDFNLESPISVYVHEQSPDISIGVDDGGAGDQGMMFGYACNETRELMPLPIILAHKLTEEIDKQRITNLKYLRPDGKSEVKIQYKDEKPLTVEKVVLAVPHDPKIQEKTVKDDLFEIVVLPLIKKYGLNLGIKDLIVNGTGAWEIGGPASDTGVTGRKIIVDTYGGMARIGGGCFSGKDPTKVDRSGAYAARFIAKNVIAAGLADRCEVQLAYVIGQRKPLTKSLETFGTEKKKINEIESFAWKLLDLSVPGIINGLDLRKPIYRKTACYGHFGREEFPWEVVKYAI